MDFAPSDGPRRSRGALWIALAAATVAAVGGAGVFLLLGPSGDDGTTQVVPDVDAEASEFDAYSFARAGVEARAAQSLHIDAELTTSGGSMVASWSIDRTSRRVYVEAHAEGDFMDPFDDSEELQYSMIGDVPGDTLWFSSSLFAASAPWVDADWLSMSLSDGMRGGDTPDEWLNDAFSDPLQLNTILTKYPSSDLGFETIDGETLNRFEVTVDVDTLLADDPDALDDYGDVDLSVLDEIVYDVWIDEGSFVRRVAFDAGADGELITMTMDIELLDGPTLIEHPDPATVVSLEEFLGAAGGPIDE